MVDKLICDRNKVDFIPYSVPEFFPAALSFVVDGFSDFIKREIIKDMMPIVIKDSQIICLIKIINSSLPSTVW